SFGNPAPTPVPSRRRQEPMVPRWFRARRAACRRTVATALCRRELYRLEGEPPGEPHPRPFSFPPVIILSSSKDLPLVFVQPTHRPCLYSPTDYPSTERISAFPP